MARHRPAVVRIEMDTAETVGREQPAAGYNSYAAVITSGGVATVWIGEKDGAGIPLANVPVFKQCDPFDKLVLTWDALAGGVITLILGNEIDAGIVPPS